MYYESVNRKKAHGSGYFQIHFGPHSCGNKSDRICQRDGHLNA
uniref:Uncharacterized protein n=1 Tax=Anguilla anguilla TaxID=7936 RepID=A0A0E9XLT3_ANGAN